MRQVKVIEQAEELLQLLLDERDTRMDRAEIAKCPDLDEPTLAVHVNVYDETAEIMGPGAEDYVVDDEEVDVFEFIKLLIRETGLPVEVRW